MTHSILVDRFVSNSERQIVFLTTKILTVEIDYLTATHHVYTHPETLYINVRSNVPIPTRKYGQKGSFMCD